MHTPARTSSHLAERASPRKQRSCRRGFILVLAAAVLVVVFAFVAFSLDLGYVALTRAQLQTSADAAAMGAALELLDLRKRNAVDLQAAQDAAAHYAALNRVAGTGPELDVAGGDVAVGLLGEDGEVTGGADPSQWNAVRVRVRRDAAVNGSLPLFFAPLLGIETAGLQAEAIAGFRGGIQGFQPATNQPTSLIPLAIQFDDWQDILQQQVGNDQWAFEQASQTTYRGSDGFREINLFTGDLLSPGNFGTLNIGEDSQSLSDLTRQIQRGVSAEDLDAYGGSLRLDPQRGSLEVGGDTGFSTPVLFAATEIIGKPVTIPLYSRVSLSGANTVFTIVGFAGARIVNTGDSGNGKRITIQPAVVVDPAAVTGGSGTSWNVYGPVKLLR